MSVPSDIAAQRYESAGDSTEEVAHVMAWIH